jgi:putative spermidine/putrescine transport system ATP-binding protein
MASLTLDRLEKRYGDSTVVSEVSLAIAPGEFVSLLGPSGCGKTTILRMVAGLAEPSAGRILIGNEDVGPLPPHKRAIGLVFQSYALFPHLTVFENVAFGLRRKGVKGGDLVQRVAETLALIHLADLGRRYPRQLSGGQQQRVALARAISTRPRLLLLDEPLSNLDAQLRDEMQIELKRLQRDLGVTSVFVTHDQAEALSLSDRVCVLASGRVQQFGTPEEVYHRPANGFVASFIGKPNRLSGIVVERNGRGGTVRVGSHLILASASLDAPVGSSVDVVVRHEAIRLGTRNAGRRGPIEGTVTLRSFTGSRVQYVVRVGEDVELVAEAPSSGLEAELPPGTAVTFSIDPAAVFAMAPEAGGRA